MLLISRHFVLYRIPLVENSLYTPFILRLHPRERLKSQQAAAQASSSNNQQELLNAESRWLQGNANSPVTTWKCRPWLIV